MTHLGQRLDPGPSGRTLGHHQDSDGLNGTVLGLRDAGGSATQRCSCSLDRIKRVGLTTAPALGSVGPVNLDHVDVSFSQESSQSRSIGAGAFNPNLGNGTEALEPLQQQLVARRSRVEGLGAEQCTERVKCGSDMDIEVGIDATGDTTSSFYDGHGHPFLLNGWGMARPFRIGVTGGPGCSCNPGQSPSFETGRAVVNEPLVRFGRRRS